MKKRDKLNKLLKNIGIVVFLILFFNKIVLFENLRSRFSKITN